MMEISKIKLSEDDFVLIEMNYNYFMIPRLAYPKENLEKLKQQILDNQEMTAELRKIWDNEMHDESLEYISHVLEKYFGKRTE